MDKQQVQDFFFYCRQLKITTFKQLFKIIKEYNIHDEDELLYILCKLYNSDFYYEVNKI